MRIHTHTRVPVESSKSRFRIGVPRRVFEIPIYRGSGERAGVLIVSIIFCMLVSLMLVAYLSMINSQHKFSYRSQTWNDAMATCEAGIEEAMAHINYSGTTSNFAINGWALTGGAYRKQRDINGGFVRMAIDTAIPPSITVTGFLKSPTQTNMISRALLVRTAINQRFPHAILGKGSITANSNGARVDSYDSTDPAKSTGGVYDPAKAGDKAVIATTSTAKNIVDLGNLALYGKAGTGPGGTVSVNNGVVGDTAWDNNPANGGKIQPGHFSDDVNMYIPQPTLPSGFGNNLPILNGLIGAVTHTYVLNGSDYRMATLTLNSGDDLYVAGNARLYVSGDSSISGTITLAPGASLEFYSGGNWDCKGSVNNPGLAKDFSFVGLSTCTIMNYNGGAKYVGTIDAPNAAVTISGGAGFWGAIISKTAKLTGGMSVHYDESLKGDPREGRYVLASYQEL